MDYDELGGAVSFRRGLSFAQVPVPPIKFTLSPDSQRGRMTDHLSVTQLHGLVFSSKLREILQNLAIHNIEYFDLAIVDPRTHQFFDDYKIANVVGLVDCIDVGKSQLKYFDSGNIKRIRKLVFDVSKIPNNTKIFRLSKRTGITVVHNSLKTAIEEFGATGCVFSKPEDYR